MALMLNDPFVHSESSKGCVSIGSNSRLCYYQPLQWCIDNRFRRFEGGAQGEHKMARGLMPARTQSAHWIAEPEFARAIGAHLKQESGSIDEYLSELDDRSPFKPA